LHSHYQSKFGSKKGSNAQETHNPFQVTIDDYSPSKRTNNEESKSRAISPKSTNNVLKKK